MWPFGFGRSYTRSSCRVSRAAAEVATDHGEVVVSAIVENVGDAPGDEVVQLYVRDEEATVARPIKELIGFQRVTLGPGETQTVAFPIPIGAVRVHRGRPPPRGRARPRHPVRRVILRDLPESVTIDLVGPVHHVPERTHYPHGSGGGVMPPDPPSREPEAAQLVHADRRPVLDSGSPREPRRPAPIRRWSGHGRTGVAAGNPLPGRRRRTDARSPSAPAAYTTSRQGSRRWPTSWMGRHALRSRRPIDAPQDRQTSARSSAAQVPAKADPDMVWWLSPIDLQVIKACGVTFAVSAIERVIEERAGGEGAASRCASRATQGGHRTGSQHGPARQRRGRPAQGPTHRGRALVAVPGGRDRPDAEVYTKAPVLASIGTSDRIGVRRASAWNNSEPEAVLVIDASGRIVGATLGNDMNLRDFEGRSASPRRGQGRQRELFDRALDPPVRSWGRFHGGVAPRVDGGPPHRRDGRDRHPRQQPAQGDQPGSSRPRSPGRR